jgi:hypothetical protein
LSFYQKNSIRLSFFFNEERLKVYDAPLREKEIQKATEEHHKKEIENKRMAEGSLVFFIAFCSPCLKWKLNFACLLLFLESMASLAQAAGVGKK